MTDYPDLEDAMLVLEAAVIVLGKDHAATLGLARAVATRPGEGGLTLARRDRGGGRSTRA